MSEEKEPTCIGSKCPNYDPNCKGNCPNYMETVWINEQSSKPKILEDCAPKRSVFMLMEMYNHIMGLKKYSCETRNVLQKLNDDTREFMALQNNNLEHRKEKCLRIRDNPLLIKKQEDNR